MDNMEYIESYFKGGHTAEQKLQFENKILNDAAFAEEVAFYISASGAIKQELYDEKQQRFRDLYADHKVVSMKPRVRALWKYMAAASVIVTALLITWFVSVNNSSPHQLADKYVQQNFKILNVTMGNGDSLQTGISLFNAGKLNEALSVFETLENNDALNSEATKYAGIVSLRLGNYDKASEYFSLLEADTGLYSNPGKFYKAITLLERNKGDDKEQAKQILQQVVDKDLEGKNEAEKWLKKF
jgi:tetratricopeptide (TPR) repeat protein